MISMFQNSRDRFSVRMYVVEPQECVLFGFENIPRHVAATSQARRIGMQEFGVIGLSG